MFKLHVKTDLDHGLVRAVEAAKSASSYDAEMWMLCERTRRRHSSQNAVVRVANKMFRVVWYTLRRRVPYRRGSEGLYRKKLKRIE